MKPDLLPPENLWLSLPALTADEAEMILNLVDELHRLLWEAYGDVVIDNCAATRKVEASGPHTSDDDTDS